MQCGEGMLSFFDGFAAFGVALLGSMLWGICLYKKITPQNWS
jgi:hypothetical protein